MLNIEKQKLTLMQTLIIFAAFTVTIAAILFVAFFLRPAAAQLDEARVNLFLQRDRIEWLERTIRDVKDPDKVSTYFIKTQQELSRKFPSDESKSLAMLSEYAQRFQLQAVQIAPEPTRPFKGGHGRTLGAEGKTCKSVLVTMTLRGAYLNLVKYLEALYKVLPAYVAVERIEVGSRAPARPPLDIKLTLSLFFLE